jgi:phosphonate transport system ATP-binding protein
MTLPVRLSARNLSKRLQGRLILADISLEAHAHELVAVLGPSGAGKTTLFRCLTGLLPADGGSIEIDGAALASLRGRRRRIGVVFQQFNLVGRLTAFDNVLAGRLGYVAWPGGPGSGRIRCRAASSSGWRSPARWPSNPD